MITLANKETWAAIVGTKVVKDQKTPVKQQKKVSSTPEHESDKSAKKAKKLIDITQTKPKLSCYNSIGQRLVVNQGQDKGVNETTNAKVSRADVGNCIAQKVGGTTEIFQQGPMIPDDRIRMQTWHESMGKEVQGEREKAREIEEINNAFRRLFQQ